MTKNILPIAITILGLSISSNVFADEFDIKNNETGQKQTLFEVLDDEEKLFQIYDNQTKYIIEVESKFYSVKDIYEATKDGTPIGDAIAKITPVENVNPETGDFIVIDIN